MPRVLDMVRARDGGALPRERARSRVSSFVYGNVTVLGAVASQDRPALDSGRAVLVVCVTAVMTLIGHLLAEQVSERMGASPAERAHHRESLGQRLRDAAPIASSGAVPAAIFAVAALGWLSTTAAGLLAVGVVVLRLFGMGLVVERLSGRGASGTAVWSGIALAAVGLVVGIVKAVGGH